MGTPAALLTVATAALRVVVAVELGVGELLVLLGLSTLIVASSKSVIIHNMHDELEVVGGATHPS
jgi:hypothetical protein